MAPNTGADLCIPSEWRGFLAYRNGILYSIADELAEQVKSGQRAFASGGSVSSQGCVSVPACMCCKNDLH